MINKVLVLIAICFISFGLYYDWKETLGICAGITWGLTNLYFIKQLVSFLLMGKQKSYLQVLLFVLIKFPLLYLVGYGLLMIPYFTPWSLLIGFSIVLVGLTQKWLWNSRGMNKQEQKTFD